MGWLSFVPDIFKGGKDLAEVFVENKEARGERRHEEILADVDRDKAVLNQFAAEFQGRANRSWWDSFVDGLNRLPRPLLTIGVLSFFVLAPLNPTKFLEIAKAYELMPAGYWALLSVIIGFYFGGRMQIKSQDMTVQKDAVKAAKDLVVMRKEFRKLDTDEETVESKQFETALEKGAPKPKNKVIAEWLEKQRSEG